MSFDVDKFMGVQFVPRESKVNLPALASFFPEGSDPVFVVRGLTGPEFARVQEAPKAYKRAEAIAEGLATGNKQEMIEAVRAAIGLGGTTPPDEAVKRIEMLVIGSVEPKLDRPAVVKFCSAFPIEFFQLTNAITILTGQGHEVGK